MIKKIIVILSTMCVIIASNFATCLAYETPQSGVYITHDGSTTYEQGWIDFEGDSLDYYMVVYLVKNTNHYGSRWNELDKNENVRLFSNIYQISGCSVDHTYYHRF